MELEEGDKLASILEAVEQKISAIEKSFQTAEESEFVSQVREFAKTHSDLATIAPIMDRIVEQHPTLKNNLNLLYKIAKGVHTDKKTQEDETKTFYDRVAEAKAKGSETSGVSSDLTQPGEAKTIEEAFDKATSQLAKTKK